jgi:hypothetical protein
MREKVIICIFFLLFPLVHIYAQIVDSSDALTYKKNIVLSLFFPKGIAEGVALRSYLRSPEWDTYRHILSDKEAFDEIFDNAADLCSGNATASILATCIAVFDHKTIPVKLLFGIVIPIPLTIENQEDFDSRVSKLPGHIYDPKIADTDKLQHFFFSAFFMHTLKMNWLVKLLGNAVEIGEDLFVVGGVNDTRDRHANDDGIRFGNSCENFSLPNPSSFLTPNP